MSQRSDDQDAYRRMRGVGWGIRRYRAEMTQTELATLLGVSQGSISAWESGSVPLTCEQVAHVELALRLPLGTLLTEAGYVAETLLGADAVAAFALGKLQSALASLGLDGIGGVDQATDFSPVERSGG